MLSRFALRLCLVRWCLAQGRRERAFQRSQHRMQQRQQWLEMCRAKVREYDALEKIRDPRFHDAFPQDMEGLHYLKLLLGDYHNWGKAELSRLQSLIDQQRTELRNRGMLDARVTEEES